MVSIAVIKHHGKPGKGRVNYILFTGDNPMLKKLRAGTQDRNLGAGAEAEAMEKGCLLTFSSWLT